MAFRLKNFVIKIFQTFQTILVSETGNTYDEREFTFWFYSVVFWKNAQNE